MTNAHGKLALHHSEHAYKRGQFAGDAPADSTRRGKGHFRVIKPTQDTGPWVVRFHRADIITAYPDGRIVLNTNGWDAHPTTRAAMGEALRTCGFRGAHMHSARFGGYSQTALYIAGKKYRYYDGMEFDAEGALLTPPVPFQKRVADTAARKAFREATKEFWGMYPVLFATRGKNRAARAIHGELYVVLQNPEHWPRIVEYHGLAYADDEMAQARSNLMRKCTKYMTKMVDVPLP